MDAMRACMLGTILVLSVEAAMISDADLLYAAATHPERYEAMRAISRVWRGKHIRALWGFPGMEAVVSARRSNDTRNEVFVASYDIGPPTPKAGDFRIVSG